MIAENATPTSRTDEDEEVVDGLPVLADVRALEPVPSAALPAVQAAAAAATGFVAGAATIALVRRRSARWLARAKPNSRARRRRPDRSSGRARSWSTST